MLPQCDPQQPDETRDAYGARALRFVLATGQTAPIDDDGLHPAVKAYRAAGIQLSGTTAERLADADRQIAAALRFRDRLAAEQSSVAQDAPLQPQACPRIDDRPDDGRLARLTPAPRVQPPSQGVAIPDFAF